MESEKPQEKCGIVGIIDLSGKEVIRRTVQMLNSLQHRGDDSAGILTLKYGFHRYRDVGLVSQIFTDDLIEKVELGGSLAIGHTRYINQGASSIDYAQPIIASFNKDVIGISHNGNIPDLKTLKRRLNLRSNLPKPEYDSSYLAHLIVQAKGENWVEKIQNGLFGIEGSYSLVIATDNGHLLGVRDPWANRPLSLARVKNGFVIASETVAFPVVKAYEKYEFKPGEIVDISKDGIFRSSLLEETKGGRCVFEKIYLSHETSKLDGETVSTVRKRLGKLLAEKHQGSGDVVTSVPESANAAARAYAYESGKPLEGLILKKRLSIKRSFMMGEMGKRKQELETKFDYSPDAKGLKIDKIDDSKIAGNTDKITNKILFEEYGVKEIHDRSTAPKIIRDCPWGVNFRSNDGKFIALDPNSGEVRSNAEIAKELGSTTIDFPSLAELKEVIDQGKVSSEEYCFYCMGGEGLQKTTLKKSSPKVEPFFKLISLD